MKTWSLACQPWIKIGQSLHSHIRIAVCSCYARSFPLLSPPGFRISDALLFFPPHILAVQLPLPLAASISWQADVLLRGEKD